MHATLLKILFYVSLISTAVVFVSSTLGVYYICKAYNAGKAIKEETFELGKDLNDEKVERYSKFVENINIPNRMVYWNTLRAGYKLVQ